MLAFRSCRFLANSAIRCGGGAVGKKVGRGKPYQSINTATADHSFDKGRIYIMIFWQNSLFMALVEEYKLD